MKKYFLMLLIFTLIFCVSNVSAEQWKRSDTKIELQVTNDKNETTKLIATLADNPTAKEFAEHLRKGTIKMDMQDAQNVEKYGTLPFSLVRDDKEYFAEAGDLFLYAGIYPALYYDNRKLSLTRLGELDAIADGSMSKTDLKKILGTGNVRAVVSIGNK